LVLQVDSNDSVDAVVTYLQRKLRIKFAVPNFQPRGDKGILDIDTSINHLIHDLRERRIGGIYLPNTRWFAVSHCLRDSVHSSCPHRRFIPVIGLVAQYLSKRSLPDIRSIGRICQKQQI
jgi:hypothetical protein